MYQVILATVSEGISIDQTTNTVSLFAIYDEITPEQLPAIVPRIQAFYLLKRSEDDSNEPAGELHVLINNRKVGGGPVPINFLDRMRLRSVVTLSGLPLPEFGLLTFVLIVDGKELSRIEVSILQPRKIGQIPMTLEPQDQSAS